MKLINDFVTKLSRRPYRFEKEDFFYLIFLLSILGVSFQLVLWRIFNDSTIESTWLFTKWVLGFENKSSVPPEFRWCFLILLLFVSAIYFCFGPKFRRVISKKYKKESERNSSKWSEVLKEIFLKDNIPLFLRIIKLIFLGRSEFSTYLNLPLTVTFPSMDEDKFEANSLYKDWHKDDTPKYSLIMECHEINKLTEGIVRD